MISNALESWVSAPLLLEGISLNPGIGMGYCVFHQPHFAKPYILPHDSVNEKKRIKDAFEGMRGEIESLLLERRNSFEGETWEVLQTYQLLSQDKGWQLRIIEAIQTGLSAEQAIETTLDGIKEQFSKDPFWQSRLYDLADLSHRLLKQLSPRNSSQSQDADQPMIVISQGMGPAELLDYNRRNLVGLIMEGTGQTSHVAIVARSLGIPVIGGISDVFSKMNPGDPILIDGDAGKIYVRPLDSTVRQFDQRVFEKTHKVLARLDDTPAISKDGVKINLHVNANLAVDLGALKKPFVTGIGLYRTEIPFMIGEKLPTVQMQTEIYQDVLEMADGKPVLFRTLDIGGDKVLPYLPGRRPDDKSSVVGSWRSVRLTLERPTLMRQQLRAFIRASVAKPSVLYLLIPMLAEVSEFIAVKNLIKLEMDRETRLGHQTPAVVKVGAMIEVPSLAYQLASLLPYVDFISVGSNDLFQFFYATDRSSEKSNNRHDVLSPAFLILLKNIITLCGEENVPISLCGEMASNPLEAMALLAIGLRSFSIAPSALDPIKNMIQTVNVQKISEYLESVSGSPSAKNYFARTVDNANPFETFNNLRHKLKCFAKDNSVII